MTQVVRNDTAAVGVTAVMLMDVAHPNHPRQFYYVRNSSTGAQVITLVFGDEQTIAANGGIVLPPTSAYFETISYGDPNEVWQGRIWAISDLAAGSVSIVERS